MATLEQLLGNTSFRSVNPGETITLKCKSEKPSMIYVGDDFEIMTDPECSNINTAEVPMNFNTTEDRLPIEFRDAGTSFAEHRTFEASEIRIAKGDDGKMHVMGYAAVFNSRSLPLKTKTGKTFVEQIKPGAFKRSIESGRDIAMLYNHDQSRVLARTSSGTLKLKEDDHGLHFDAALPDTTAARDLTQDVEHGNIRGTSFGFGDPEDKWEKDGDLTVRTLEVVPLGEVSPTPFPAYPATEISIRAIDDAIDRLEGGETEVRGSMYYSQKRSMMESCRSHARNLADTIRSLHEHLLTDTTANDEHEKRSGHALHESLGELRSASASLRSHIGQSMMDGGDADSDDDSVTSPTPVDPLLVSDDERSYLERGLSELIFAAREGLPTEAIRNGIMSFHEIRGGESVNSACASRARKAITDGKDKAAA